MTAALEATASASDADRAAGAQLRIDLLLSLERAGWSSDPSQCTAKVSALASLASLPPPEPVARVSYQSRGNLLVIAGEDSARAQRAADALAPHLHVTLLEAAGTPSSARHETWAGRIDSLDGYLGQFTATIAGLKTAKGAAAKASTAASFDLVLDFSREPLFAMRQPPQGYFAAPAADAALQPVLAELRDAVGEFEKPRFFAYRENLCAHSRSEVEGCSACIEICSTRAISSDGDHVKVDPHLCMGCGACATVCPSGAMGYQFPRVADRGAQLKQLLSAYRQAGGSEPRILFHNGTDGRALLETAAGSGAGLAPAMLPLEAWHVASIGLDVLLPAVAFGARQVAVLSAGSEDSDYVSALRAQMAIGEAILAQLGYEGTHFAVIEASTPQQVHAGFAALGAAAGVPEPAQFLVGNDKRTAIEFAVEHLVKHAPRKVDEIALPAGAPFGQVGVDRQKCTMCMACVGACPSSALMDGRDLPMLKFLERNCVQCGLCESTCPEEAIALSPRLLLTPAVRQERVLNETEPFRCIRCSKPFGTKQMVDAMMGRLAGHSMFAGGAAIQRLQMCADCRVVDMMSSKQEVSVLKLGAGS